MTIATDIQKLYIAYFNRPADYLGLKYWTAQANANGGSVAAVANAFSASAEYTTQFAGQSSAQIINTIYMNLFGRPAEPAAIDYWGTRLDNKTFNIGTIATSILNGAQNDDAKTVTNKVAAAEAFYGAMDTTAEITGYDGPAANAVVKTWLSTVTSDTATLTAATAAAALNTVLANAAAAHDNTTGSNFTLTAGNDNLIGTAGNDVFTVAGTNPTTGAALTVAQSFDVVTGGAGTDTINWYADTGSNDTISGSFTGIEIANFYGADKITGGIDASKIGGLQQVWLQSTGAATTVTGLSGKTVGVAGNTTGTVSANFGGTATAANVALKGAAGTGGTGNATVDLIGAGLTAATVSGAGKATLTSGAANLATLNVKADSATSLTVTGLTNLTAIDASGSAGDLTLTGIAAGVTSIKGGAGVDTLTLTATTKATVDLGAGADVITLNSAVAAGSTINLGAGNDKVLVNGGSVAVSTSTAATVIDGGEGVDAIAAALLNAGNAAQFKNFEVLDASSAATLDISLVTGSTLTGIALSGGANGSVLSNVGATLGLSVSGVNAGSTTIGVTNAATGTADAYTVTFAGEAATAATNVDAGTVVLNDIETVNLVSAGGANNSNIITLTDSKLQSVVITGNKDLTLDFAGTNGTVSGTAGGVATINGSAATGKLNIDLANVTASAATAGLTVTGGSAADTLKVSTFAATLTGGAGADNFNVSAAVAGASFATAPVVTTITDFAKGDILTLGTTTGFTATKVNVAAATTLATALDLAAAGTTAGVATWFQFGGNTYVVDDLSAATTLTATDIVVKLTGTLDLSTSTLATNALTFA